MTDDQVRDLVMVLVFIAFIFFVFGGLYLRLYRYYKRKGLDSFDEIMGLLGHERSEYRFFTDGHPEVWCETTEEEIKRGIVNQCIYPMSGLGVPGPSNYVMNVNEERKAVYVVFGDGRNFSFNWDSLIHYEEWIGSDLK